MKCPKCKKELQIPDRAYLNFESYYAGGGTVLVASDCCGVGIVLQMEVSFSAAEYTGDRKEDDWGSKLSKSK